MITFSKDISTSNFLNAYNNNVVEFSSDNVSVAIQCTINISGYNFTITPINNVFRYNFKEVLSVLINSNNFKDEILPTLVVFDSTSLVYNDTANTFINPLVTYTILFEHGIIEQTTVTYKWLKSVEQLEQNKLGVVTGGNNIYALSPFLKETANTYNVTYFEGYPFDISILLNNTGTVTVLNQTNALSYNFTMANTVNRLFFSDGRTTITINDYLPLVDGLNKLKITSGTDFIYINVTKIPSVEGQYLKWINQYGGWSYWLFNCVHKRQNKIKDLGSVNNDFENVADTTNPFLNIGKTSVDTLTLISDNINDNDQTVLNGLIDSPLIYYYTGTRLSQVTDVSWLAVKLKSTNNVITDYKKRFKKYKLQFELPERYTMKL
jgi:hypothetical protein